MDNKLYTLDDYFSLARNEDIDVSVNDIRNMVSNAKYQTFNKTVKYKLINIKQFIMISSILLTGVISGLLFINSNNSKNTEAVKPVKNKASVNMVKAGNVKEITKNVEEINKLENMKGKVNNIFVIKNVDSLPNKPLNNKAKKIAYSPIKDDTTNTGKKKQVRAKKVYTQKKNVIITKCTIDTNIMYDKIYNFDYNGGLWAKVVLDRKIGFIDTAGREVVHPRYSRVDFFDNYKIGWLKVKENNKYGFIDTTGKQVTPNKYTKIGYFDEYKVNWMLVESCCKYGFIDTSGKEIVPLKYCSIGYFGEYYPDWMKVTMNKKIGFINSKGKEVVYPKYDKVEYFDEYKVGWMLVKRDGKYGFIDTTGKEVVPVRYDKIGYFDEVKPGWMKVKRNGKKLFIDTTGKEVFSRKNKK